jgi:hypothetical protein
MTGSLYITLGRGTISSANARGCICTGGWLPLLGAQCNMEQCLVLDYVNQIRANHSAPPLAWANQLAAAALQWGQEISARPPPQTRSLRGKVWLVADDDANPNDLVLHTNALNQKRQTTLLVPPSPRHTPVDHHHVHHDTAPSPFP